MVICWRSACVPLVLFSLSICGTVGCNHQLQPNPYAQPPYGNPWASPYPGGPPAATTLPPPPGQQAPAPYYPAAPNLPSPPGASTPATPPTAPYSAIQRPDWNNPGTLSQQQQRANMFDPFASNELGPEIVGGRPREFQKPMTETTRVQGFRDTRIPF